MIMHLKHRYQDWEGMEFLVADARSLSRFEDSSFDFIFEKACIDSQFASTNTYNVVLQINQEICRILKPGRNFMSISCAIPHARDPHYGHRSLNWFVDHANINGRGGIFAYIMTKNRGNPYNIDPSDTEFVKLDAEFIDDEEKEAEILKKMTYQTKSAASEGYVKRVKVRDMADLLAAEAQGTLVIRGKYETGVL